LAKKILTQYFKIDNAERLLEDIQQVPHYVFTAKISEYLPNDLVVPDVEYGRTDITSRVYYDMLFGKKIQVNDIQRMVKRSIWQTGTVYDQYSYTEPNLMDRNFFTASKIGSVYYVYKCLFNNSDSPSTVQPTGQDLKPFQTSDGYIWKYLYNFSLNQDEEFSTPSYMPVLEDPAVKSAAIPGTIDSIDLTVRGSEYPNFTRSAFQFGSIRVGGDSEKYYIDSSESSFVNFFRGCTIRVLSGVAKGEYRKIIEYQVDMEANKKIIILESEFTNTPAVGDLYEIMPTVEIKGDGFETKTAKAIAIVDAETHYITSIEVLDPGEGYTRASATVEIEYDSMVPLKAEVVPNVAPLNGHGSDIFSELGAEHVSVSVDFNNSENDKIPASNDFRTIGILKNPLFDNVLIAIDEYSTKGRFNVGETFYQFMESKLYNTVTVTPDSLTAISTNSGLVDSLSVGDYVLFKTETRNHMTKITGVSDSYFTFDRNVTWALGGGSLCDIYSVKILAKGKISRVESNFLVVDSLDANLNPDIKLVYGYENNGSGVINQSDPTNLTINGIDVENFRVFNQLTRLVGSYLSTSQMIPDEVITQNGSSAMIHSVKDDSGTITLNVTNVQGNFDSTKEIVGQTSGASFMLLNKYPGQLKVNSGDILYVEDVLPITRTDSSSERIKIIVSY
jgi:hypothetical protein